MKRNLKSTSLMLSALAVVVAASVGFKATTHELCDGFVPENNMKIPVGWNTPFGRNLSANGGLTEEQFNAVLDRVEALYAPVIAQLGGKLVINRLWNDPTVNASAEQTGGDWILNMYGGLARHSEINVEGMALVACHELGHHLGGAPKVSGWWGSEWATNEGGADYFATLKCLRYYFAQDDNESIIAAANIQPIAKQNCESQFSDHTDQLICMRNTMAGDSVAGLFMDLKKEKKRPRYDTPDPTEVAQTDDEHPETQCRMDTYFAGAICHVAKDTAVSNDDFKQGSCVQGTDEFGWRPRCWFKPE